DLGRLLAEQTRPDAQLTLPLQGGGLGVQPAYDDQVVVQAAVLVVGEVDPVVRVLDPFPVGGEELHELRFRWGCARGLRHPYLPVGMRRQRDRRAGLVPLLRSERQGAGSRLRVSPTAG